MAILLNLVKSKRNHLVRVVLDHTITEIFASYLGFSHSPLLLNANGCKINCSMDV